MNRQKAQGFTLMELMVVIAIIGILAAVAFPSYQAHAREARRVDGMSMLSEVMQAQERHFASNLSYTENLIQLDYAAAPSSAEGYYVITAAACGGGLTACVNLTATPQGDQVADGDLTLNSLGVRTGAGWD
ncbi:type IV pilin protein [Sinobacterium caligoides]|nr:type IV pilin protein [Sinobacterium caligoides]